MSRIHDALKKAEQEKFGITIPEEVRSPEAAALKSGAPNVSTFGSETKAVPTRSAMDAVSRGKLQESLLERCRRYQWSPDRNMMLFFDRRNSVCGLEELRTLRSHLDKIRQKQPLQKLLITSPLPQEGKTTLAANLAQVIARQKERWVLLIDADLRLSRMHLPLGAPPVPGLSEYLAGEADEFSITQRGQLDNLFFIPGGRSVPNPTELIGNGRLGTLLQRLAPAFDSIVMDSPPTLPVSDAKLLADSCDGVLMVIQAGTTPFDLAQKACREFRDKAIVGAVLNRAETGSDYSPSYYTKSRQKKVIESRGMRPA
jgi:protein-tyrosine kinase